MNKRIATNGGRLMGINELSQYLGVGLNTAKSFGRNHGAVVTIGTRVLYDRAVIDEAIESERLQQGGNNAD